MALGKTTIPLLQAAEQKIQQSVKPPFQAALQAVVHAGLSIMYSPGLQATMLHHLKNVENPAQEAGTGAARMIGELQKQAQGKIPQPVLMPAAITFVCEYFDLLAKVGKVQVTPDLLAQASQIAAQTMLDASGIKQGDIQRAIAQRGKPPKAGPSAPPEGGIIGAQMQGA